MNITTTAKAATRQALAEAQDARAVVIDAVHLWNHHKATKDDCIRVFEQYSDRPTLVERAASVTILRAMIITHNYIHRNDVPDWLSVEELTVEEAMAVLRKLTGLGDDAQA